MFSADSQMPFVSTPPVKNTNTVDIDKTNKPTQEDICVSKLESEINSFKDKYPKGSVFAVLGTYNSGKSFLNRRLSLEQGGSPIACPEHSPGDWVDYTPPYAFTAQRIVRKSVEDGKLNTQFLMIDLSGEAFANSQLGQPIRIFDLTFNAADGVIIYISAESLAEGEWEISQGEALHIKKPSYAILYKNFLEKLIEKQTSTDKPVYVAISKADLLGEELWGAIKKDCYTFSSHYRAETFLEKRAKKFYVILKNNFTLYAVGYIATHEGANANHGQAYMNLPAYGVSTMLETLSELHKAKKQGSFKSIIPDLFKRLRYPANFIPEFVNILRNQSNQNPNLKLRINAKLWAWFGTSGKWGRLYLSIPIIGVILFLGIGALTWNGISKAIYNTNEGNNKQIAKIIKGGNLPRGFSLKAEDIWQFSNKQEVNSVLLDIGQNEEYLEYLKLADACLVGVPVYDSKAMFEALSAGKDNAAMYEAINKVCPKGLTQWSPERVEQMSPPSTSLNIHKRVFMYATALFALYKHNTDFDKSLQSFKAEVVKKWGVGSPDARKNVQLANIAADVMTAQFVARDKGLREYTTALHNTFFDSDNKSKYADSTVVKLSEDLDLIGISKPQLAMHFIATDLMTKNPEDIKQKVKQHLEGLGMAFDGSHLPSELDSIQQNYPELSCFFRGAILKEAADSIIGVCSKISEAPGTSVLSQRLRERVLLLDQVTWSGGNTTDIEFHRHLNAIHDATKVLLDSSDTLLSKPKAALTELYKIKVASFGSEFMWSVWMWVSIFATVVMLLSIWLARKVYALREAARIMLRPLSKG
jgi:hypothetical protein